MKPHKPRVSVVVPAYNVERFIGATLDSLERQVYQDFEVLVVDDGSKDGTVTEARRRRRVPVKVVQHDVNRGLWAARNTGIAHAEGELIALLDADDLAMPERLAVQVAALDADPELVMVGSHVSVISEHGGQTGIVWRRPVCPQVAAAQLLFRNTLSAVMTLRRSAIPREGYRAFPAAEDYDFNVRMADQGKIANVDQVLTQVRVRAGGLTQSRQETMEACVREIMRSQLGGLGVEPLDRELELNRHIGAYTLSNSVGLLREIEAWLHKLDEANLARRRFPDALFKRVLSMEWYEVCKFAAPIGLRAWEVWRTSAWARYWQADLNARARLFMKCILRHERAGGDVPALV